MRPLYEVEMLANQRYQSALSHSKNLLDYDRSVRKCKACVALERLIKESILNGASLGEVKRDMHAVLRRVAE